MDSVFWITCFALACQFAVVTYRNVGPVQPEVETPKAYAKAAGKAVEEAAKAAAALRVGDAALACLNYPGGWMWPLAVAALVTYLLRRKSTVYLLDFSLFEPPEEWKKSQAELVQLMNNIGRSMKSYEEPDLEFMAKVLGNSGTGDATAWPPGILQCEDPTKQQDQTMVAARHEAETVICSTLQRLFESTGLKPKQVDFLIINCSLFSPTPSLCAMASNRFGLRSNCRTFNLSGQGCSASLLSVDLAAELLQNNPCSLAVVVSTELITQSLYHGHEKALLPATLPLATSHYLSLPLPLRRPRPNPPPDPRRPSSCRTRSSAAAAPQSRSQTRRRSSGVQSTASVTWCARRSPTTSRTPPSSSARTARARRASGSPRRSSRWRATR